MENNKPYIVVKLNFSKAHYSISFGKLSLTVQYVQH